ncbi:MAG: YdbH domain-containing protein [Brevundimonas sp.]|uniref:intermembrane phospholipid transport protein YdbH family protein n=1 Tax=Brevundimonas sp. TaxID=1871086 RepID=UPI003919D7E3
MSDTQISQPASPVIPDGVRRRRRPGGGPGRLLVVALVILGLLLAAALSLYAARREAARQILVGWLEQRGIEADVQIERLELDTLTARIRVGDRDNPDFSVERVEMDYALGLPWSPSGLGVTPSRIRLIRPILRAGWRDGVFSMGSLDPLIDEFRGRPPGPDARGPLVLIEQGRLLLTTDYGPLDVRADARIEDGRLMRLSARAAEANLVSGDTHLALSGARLDLATTGERTRFDVAAVFAEVNAPGLSGEAVRAGLIGEAPYPDLNARRSEGDLHLTATLAAGRLEAGDVSGRAVGARVGLNGRVNGWLESFTLSGESEGMIGADVLTLGQTSASGARMSISETVLDMSRRDGALRWRLDGPMTLLADRMRSGDLTLAGLDVRSGAVSAGGRSGAGRASAFEMTAPASFRARRLQFGDLSLTGIDGRMDADVTGQGVVLVEAAGRLRAARGRWPLLGEPGADDPPELAALKQALGGFGLEASSFRLRTGSTGTELVLGQAARITPLNGGLITLGAHSGAPLYAARPGQTGGGALILTGTAPETDVRVAVPQWRLTSGGFTALLDGAAGFNFGFARDVNVAGAGTLTSGGGRLTFRPDGCVAITAAQLAFGENDARGLSGALCARDGPLVTVADGGWTAAGRMQDAAAEVPFLAMGFSNIAGPLTVRGTSDGLALEAEVETARAADTTQPQRFYPLEAAGAVSLAEDVWQGRFDLSRGPHRLGSVDLKHDGRAEAGGVAFDASGLTFAEGGLQPGDVTPLTAGLVDPPVIGGAGFTGRFDWTPEGATSSGVLTVRDLDFVSPVGPVTGLNGEVAFTSLTPLITAPDQRLTAEGLAALAPITDLNLLFELGAGSFQVSGVDLDVAGGQVIIEPFTVPLDRTLPFAGTLVFENVQLSELIGGAGFGEQVLLNAVVSGRVPFTWDQANGFRVVDGSLYAVQPGRLEIEREALSGLEAGGGGEDVPPNVVQDLAYQAMEDLAFDILTAQVNSLDEGRLGVLFRIRGRHDPAQRQELRLTLSELISRDFLNRELPLPSGTEIDLTLDTTLNLNELVSDLLSLNRARRGERDENSRED